MPPYDLTNTGHATSAASSSVGDLAASDAASRRLSTARTAGEFVPTPPKTLPYVVGEVAADLFNKSLPGKLVRAAAESAGFVGPRKPVTKSEIRSEKPRDPSAAKPRAVQRRGVEKEDPTTTAPQASSGSTPQSTPRATNATNAATPSATPASSIAPSFTTPNNSSSAAPTSSGYNSTLAAGNSTIATQNSSDGGLSPGAWSGIAIGALVGGAALVTAAAIAVKNYVLPSNAVVPAPPPPTAPAAPREEAIVVIEEKPRAAQSDIITAIGKLPQAHLPSPPSPKTTTKSSARLVVRTLDATEV